MESLLQIDRRLAPVLAGAGSGAQAAPQLVGAFCEALGWSCGTFWARDVDVPTDWRVWAPGASTN